MSFRVVAPLVLARDKGGETHHVFEGGVIDWLSDKQEAHFLATGLVEKVGGPDHVEGEPPTKAASKAEWVEYAVADGYDRDEVEAMTKADIQALFD